MNEITVTVVGNVATDVRHVTSKNGTSIASFRLANTPRRLERGEWKDMSTSFMTVTCWRGLADNTSSSIKKGDPVIVLGRLRVNDWKHNDRTGREVEIDALTVGHDMTKGTSAFLKTTKDSRTSDDDQAAAEELRQDLREPSPYDVEPPLDDDDARYRGEPSESPGTPGEGQQPEQLGRPSFAA